jgi:carboxyl-terminal processing protease
MKKVIIVIASLVAACILLTGIFSAGLVVGGLFIAERNQPEISQSTPTMEMEVSESEGDTPPEPVVEPTDEPSLLSELNPFKTDEPEDTPPQAPSEDLDEIFDPFWQAWEIVDENYVDQPIDQEALMRGAIEGMLDALGDQHTSYMDPEDYKESTTVFEGEEEYEGIGAWVDISKDYLTIIAPFPDSPAEKAGLKPGDQILAIDGEDMTGLDGELVRQKVLGPADTTITLTILRSGYKPFDVDVTRDSVTVPSIETYMMDDDIGYIRLFLFGDKTADELREALDRHMADGAKGIILDLRYNGGGYVDSAIDVTSEFISEGQVVMIEEYGDGTRDILESKSGGRALDIPLVLLVNEGSASASEIVAGVFQDYDRAPLVGTTTFGKGSVQYWIPLDNDQGAVRVTIARWLTPNERLIHEVGLEPDYPVWVVHQAAIDEGFDIETLGVDLDEIIILSDEEVSEGRDPQMEKAIEVLKGLFE